MYNQIKDDTWLHKGYKANLIVEYSEDQSDWQVAFLCEIMIMAINYSKIKWALPRFLSLPAKDKQVYGKCIHVQYQQVILCRVFKTTS